MSTHQGDSRKRPHNRSRQNSKLTSYSASNLKTEKRQQKNSAQKGSKAPSYFQSVTQMSANVEKFSYPEQRRPRKATHPVNTPISLGEQQLKNRNYIFVYGTLKKGFPNAYLLETATYIGSFRTLAKYPLVVGGKYYLPYLLDVPNTGNRVKGEVYAVDNGTLADLDHLEKVGINYTRRVEKFVSCTDRSVVVDAFAYFKGNEIEKLITSKFLEDYQCRRYIPHQLR